MLGKVSQLTGNVNQDIVALYDQFIALRRELYDLLNNLDDDNIRKITAKSIDTGTLVVGENIAMGPKAVISWTQVADQPFIPGDDYITTITEDTIMTANLLARNLEVEAANISGILTADQITTNISQVNNVLHLGEGYQSYSSLSFDGIGGIDAYGNNLVISAMEGISIPTSTFFGNSVYFDGNVNFDNAAVSGLKVRLG